MHKTNRRMEEKVRESVGGVDGCGTNDKGDEEGNRRSVGRREKVERKGERRRRKTKDRELWKKEEERLKERIRKMEGGKEDGESDDKKNNIIIKGITWRLEKLEHEIEEYIRV